MKFLIYVLLSLSFFTISLFGTPAFEETPDVIATTSWTAAFALAAGADDVHVLAPYALRHPAEYELKPSDIALISDAGYIIYAGYEVMAGKIQESIDQNGPELIHIATDYSMATIRQSVMKIARILGTTDKAQRNIEQIETFIGEWRQELVPFELTDRAVIAHVFQKPLLDELGARIAGVFGPAPVEARQIAELSDKDAALVVDNWHNDVGKPLRNTMKDVPQVIFLNFPGEEDTRTLIDVLKFNRRELGKVLADEASAGSD